MHVETGDVPIDDYPRRQRLPYLFGGKQFLKAIGTQV